VSNGKILARVDADLALVSVLAYRAVAIWLPALVGLAALGALRRTMAGWTRKDAPRRHSTRRTQSTSVPFAGPQPGL
jgi:hypothetical protein